MPVREAPNYEAFPPGNYIRQEIEYRGWSQSELARIMGRPVQVINQIINGSKAITAKTARELEAALGPDAQAWLNLETSWRLYIEAKADPAIAARARRMTRHPRTGQPSGLELSEHEGLGINAHGPRQRAYSGLIMTIPLRDSEETTPIF